MEGNFSGHSAASSQVSSRRGHGAYEEAGLEAAEADRLVGLTAELMLERLRAFEDREGRLNLEEVPCGA